jgi:hypothetical protein
MNNERTGGIANFGENDDIIKHNNNGLIVDIHNVRKFSDKCKKAYDRF